jgi:hypothetical protein
MKETKTPYHKLRSLVENGQVNIRLILSPPRTGSTLMETKLTQFKGIQANYHEPFVELGYYNGRAEEGYANILSAIKNLRQDGPITVLVKEMSHWLGVDREFERFLPLVKDPILFLIRNPLLSIESKIRKVLEVWDMREKPKLVNWLRRELEIKPDGEGLHFQRNLLNQFARSKGKKNWAALLENRFNEQDYRVFGELLKIEGLFPLSNTGWQALEAEIDCLKNLGREYCVVDSTIFRLNPQRCLGEIAQSWNIAEEGRVDYSPEEIRELGIRMHKPHYRLWYDTLLKNEEVRFPTEPIPELSSFPDEISNYLKEMGIPIYIHTFMDEYRLTLESCSSRVLREYDPYIAMLLESGSIREYEGCNLDRETLRVWQEAFKSFTVEGDFYGRRK